MKYLSSSTHSANDFIVACSIEGDRSVSSKAMTIKRRSPDSWTFAVTSTSFPVHIFAIEYLELN